MHELLTASAMRQAAAIRSGAISSRELVARHLERVEAVNGTINAVVERRDEAALAEADAADEVLAREGPDGVGPLHGVPCSIKECFGVTGMLQTSGLYSRREVRAEEDATAVARLRGAGAIVVGTTNVSELCMWMETSNAIYGITRNPYDPTRIVGGSSGGEGAIVSARGTPFGLGADIGGSIRMPAFFNGVFGHKPTGGLVPGSGQYPNAENEALRFVTTGPIARHAEDLLPVLRVLAGPDGIDDGCYAMPIREPSDVDLSKLRVLHVPHKGTGSIHPELASAQERVAAHLASLGAKVKATFIPGFERSFDIWAAMLGDANDTPFMTLMGNGEPFHPWLELGRWLTGRSRHTLPGIALAAAEPIAAHWESRVARFVDEGRALRAHMAELLGDDGVMLYPSYPRPAPMHRVPLLLPFHWVYAAILNVLEMPSTQVPTGLNEDGLPLGVQVAAAPGRDHLTLAVALELERAFGGWTPPPEPIGG